MMGCMEYCVCFLTQPWFIHKTALTSISDDCVLNSDTYFDYIFVEMCPRRAIDSFVSSSIFPIIARTHSILQPSTEPCQDLSLAFSSVVYTPSTDIGISRDARVTCDSGYELPSELVQQIYKVISACFGTQLALSWSFFSNSYGNEERGEMTMKEKMKKRIEKNLGEKT